MVSVSIVGGGTAGVEAARTASAYGAEVTIYDRLEEPEPPWSSWVDQILPTRGATLTKDSEGPCPGSIITGDVRSLHRGEISTATGVKIACDIMVLAAGSRFEPVAIQGRDKRGVIVLDKFWRYVELGPLAASSAKAIIYGEGERALEIADRVAGRGTRITVGVSHWKHGRPSSQVESVIRESAGPAEVALIEGGLQRALGARKLEAVVFDGSVLSCDTLVVVPRRHPTLPLLDAKIGRGGGLLVDRQLKSSAPAILAAGASAEVSEGLPPFSSLDAEPVTSGMVAGANASGRKRTIEPVRMAETHVFGLRWSRAGLATLPELSCTPAYGVASQRRESSACTLVYHKRSGKILGIEMVARSTDRTGGIRAIVSVGETLETLAYGGSTDITLVSETARIGIRSWSRS